MDDGSGAGYVSLTSARTMLDALLKGWSILLGGAILGLLLSILSLLSGQTYDSTIIIAPAQSSSATESGANTGLSSLAAIAGIGSGGSSPLSAYDQFLLTLHSSGLAQALLSNKPLMQRMFLAEWDDASASWHPAKSPIQNLSRAIDSVFGFNRPSYLSVDDVQKYLGSRLRVVEDKGTSVRTVTFRTSNPQLSFDILMFVHKQADNMVRESDFAYLNDQVSYLDRRLETVTNLDHRQQLVAILSEYEKRLMLAEGHLSYASRIIDLPQVAKAPSSPRPIIILTIGTIVGLVIGIGLVALMHLRNKATESRSSIIAKETIYG